MIKEINIYVNRSVDINGNSYVEDQSWIRRHTHDNETQVLYTDQLALLLDCWNYIDDGWNIIIHIFNYANNEDFEYIITDGMKTPSGKKLKKGNNLLKMVIDGAFGKISIV